MHDIRENCATSSTTLKQMIETMLMGVTNQRSDSRIVFEMMRNPSINKPGSFTIAASGFQQCG
jgi:hypothetical protein